MSITFKCLVQYLAGFQYYLLHFHLNQKETTCMSINNRIYQLEDFLNFSKMSLELGKRKLKPTDHISYDFTFSTRNKIFRFKHADLFRIRADCGHKFINQTKFTFMMQIKVNYVAWQIKMLSVWVNGHMIDVSINNFHPGDFRVYM
jgi:hypothetical protein